MTALREESYGVQCVQGFPNKFSNLTKATMNEVFEELRFVSKNWQRIPAILITHRITSRWCTFVSSFQFSFQTSEKTIRNSRIETRGTIFNKSCQMLSYANNIDIVGKLVTFERKILRNFFGAFKDYLWRQRYNFELYNLFEDADIIRNIKISRLRWIGHVKHMNDEWTAHKMLNAKQYGTIRTGRPKLKWLDDVEQDIKILQTMEYYHDPNGRKFWRKPRLTTAVAPTMMMNNLWPQYSIRGAKGWKRDFLWPFAEFEILVELISSHEKAIIFVNISIRN